MKITYIYSFIHLLSIKLRVEIVIYTKNAILRPTFLSFVFSQFSVVCIFYHQCTAKKSATPGVLIFVIRNPCKLHAALLKWILCKYSVDVFIVGLPLAANERRAGVRY